MDVLTSLGLHNLVDIIQSKLSQPPSYTASLKGEASSSTHSSPQNVTQESAQPPCIPPRPRQPTEHDSLASLPASINFDNDHNSSLPASAISLEGFSLDGKTGWLSHFST